MATDEENLSIESLKLGSLRRIRGGRALLDACQSHVKDFTFGDLQADEQFELLNHIPHL